MHKHVRVWGGVSREVAGSHARMQGVLLYNNKFVVVTIPLPMRAHGWWRDAPDARDGPWAIRSVEVQ